MYSKFLAVALVAVIAATSLLATPAHAVRGADISEPFSVEAFKCAKRSGMDFLIVRCYQSFGAPDPRALESLNNAKAAGIKKRDVYHFPCRGKNPAQQVQESMNAVGKGNFQHFYFDIETNPSPGCGWSGNLASNCKFLEEMIKAAHGEGKHVGVYASQYMWSSIMGDGCTAGVDNGAQLWYAHYDGWQSFGDYSPFGGWSKPSIKQYGDNIGICGLGSDADWYP